PTAYTHHGIELFATPNRNVSDSRPYAIDRALRRTPPARPPTSRPSDTSGSAISDSIRGSASGESSGGPTGIGPSRRDQEASISRRRSSSSHDSTYSLHPETHSGSSVRSAASPSSSTVATRRRPRARTTGDSRLWT